MALNASVGTLTSVNTTGNKTISLPSNFDPKAIILWATKNTADGSIAHWDFSVGFGTYRGATVQQNGLTIRGLDAAAIADLGQGSNTNHLIKLYTDAAASATVALLITLVSMSTGGTSNVIVNVGTAAAAAWRVHYLILGGAEIADALAGSGAAPSGTGARDVALPSGFGQPNLVFFKGNSGPPDAGSQDAQISFGWALRDSLNKSRCVGFAQTDGNTASLTSQHLMDSSAYRIAFQPAAAATTILLQARLDTALGSWPADGFREIWDIVNAAAVGDPYHWLALRTTAQIATGNDNSGANGTNTDDDVGFAPKVALLIGYNSGAGTLNTDRTADIIQAAIGIGAYDGTNMAWAGFSEDDAALTMDSNMQSSTAAAIVHYSAAAAFQCSATAAFVGNVFRRTWTVTSLTGMHNWLVLGDAAGGSPKSLVPARRPNPNVRR